MWHNTSTSNILHHDTSTPFPAQLIMSFVTESMIKRLIIVIIIIALIRFLLFLVIDWPEDETKIQNLFKIPQFHRLSKAKNESIKIIAGSSDIANSSAKI
jgi:hypothetical protein